MRNKIEHEHAVRLAEWLTMLNLPFWHPNQEMWTPSWGQKMKAKAEGAKRGLCDYLVIIPAQKSKYKRQLTLWIELKQPKKQLKRKSTRGEAGDWVSVNDATPEQLAFLELINKSGDTVGQVCYGYDEAKAFVNQYLV